MLRPKYVYVIGLYNGESVRVEAEEIIDNPSKRIEDDQLYICWAEHMLRMRERIVGPVTERRRVSATPCLHFINDYHHHACYSLIVDTGLQTNECSMY
jgi:hypothetical protein